jgi:hypothetical protein
MKLRVSFLYCMKTMKILYYVNKNHYYLMPHISTYQHIKTVF